MRPDEVETGVVTQLILPASDTRISVPELRGLEQTQRV